MSVLILVRHGQSIWNLQNRFTGWVDVSLSRKGMEEAEQVGKMLSHTNIDVAFTSVLLRAQDTLYEILKHNVYCQQYVRVHEKNQERYEHFTALAGDEAELKIFMSENLNERFYGDLQGLNKDKVRKQFGAEKVHQWRRSYDIPPPNGESLEMTAERTMPYFHQSIVPQLHDNKTVLVSAHGNSLRAIIMHIEKMTPAEILNYELATGAPHIYEFDENLQITNKEILTRVL